MTQVDDKGRNIPLRLRVIHHEFELVRLQTKRTNLLQELPLLPDAMRQEAHHHQDEDRKGEAPEPMEERSTPLSKIPEEPPCQKETLSPQNRPGKIPYKEARIRHAGLPGDRSSHRTEPGHKLRKQQRHRPPASEIALRLADAGRSLKRKLAQQLQNTVAVTPPQRKPHRIGDHASRQNREKNINMVNPMRRRKCPGRQQQRDARNRHTNLFHQDPEEDDQVRVMDEEN